MVAPFADVVEKMAKEAISETPVKTEFGYHVIKLEDKRPIKLPSFDTVKPQLQRVIEQKKMREYVQTLRTVADVKVLLDPAKPAIPAATPAADAKTAAPTPTVAPVPVTPTAPAAPALNTAPVPVTTPTAPVPATPAATTPAADAKTTAPAAPAPVPATTPAAPAPAQ
jgi:hypothetical protein